MDRVRGIPNRVTAKLFKQDYFKLQAKIDVEISDLHDESKFYSSLKKHCVDVRSAICILFVSVQYRYCIIHHGIFYYFEDWKSKKPSGYFSLAGYRWACLFVFWFWGYEVLRPTKIWNWNSIIKLFELNGGVGERSNEHLWLEFYLFVLIILGRFGLWRNTSWYLC